MAEGGEKKEPQASVLTKDVIIHDDFLEQMVQIGKALPRNLK